VPTVHYQHTQPAHAVRFLTCVAIGGALAAAVFAPEVRKPGWYPDVILVGIAAVMAVAVALFWSMTVQVTGEALEFWFGPGVIRRRVPLADIVTAEEVRTTIWQGWGIHWTTRGWLYNVSGFDAVRGHLKTGKAILVGTDEPQALADAIREGISRTAGGTPDG